MHCAARRDGCRNSFVRGCHCPETAFFFHLFRQEFYDRESRGVFSPQVGGKSKSELLFPPHTAEAGGEISCFFPST